MNHQTSFLIANCISFIGDLPLEIGNGVTLRRATLREAEKLKNVLSQWAGDTASPQAFYETEIVSGENGSRTYSPLVNPSSWHYYNILDNQGGDKIRELEQALLLLDPCLELSVRLLTHQNPEEESQFGGYGPPRPHIIERYYYGIRFPSSRYCLEASHFINAEQIRAKLISLGAEMDFVKYAVSMWGELRRIPDASRLKIIGLFAIIENLLTHSPRLAESLDSISHQLNGKLRLMTNKMRCHNLLIDAFGSQGDNKVWKKLYSYRSAIAHGTAVDFKGPLSALKSNDNVANFLSNFCRTLILQSIDEPQFFSDLKEC